MCKWYLETLLAESSFITYIPPFSHPSTPPHITTPSPSFYIPWQSHPLIYCTASILCLPVYPCMRLLNIYTVWCLSCEFIELSPPQCLRDIRSNGQEDRGMSVHSCLFWSICFFSLTRSWFIQNTITFERRNRIEEYIDLCHINTIHLCLSFYLVYPW